MVPLPALLSVVLSWTPRLARGGASPLEELPSRSASHSQGLPSDGQLQRAVRLRPSAAIRLLPEVVPGGNFYGTAELVGLLEQAARAVQRRWADGRLTVGELSAARGGPISGHNSHRNGRDADLAFFMRDASGQPNTFWRFVSFGRTETADPTRRFHFDDARNWSLVASMLRDASARIQYIFVSRPIRDRLLIEARRRGEGEEFLRVAAAVMVEPQKGHKHANHFHVRIYCAPDDRPECLDSEPYWPWYDGVPPARTYAELPTIRWRVPAAMQTASVDAPR